MDFSTSFTSVFRQSSCSGEDNSDAEGLRITDLKKVHTTFPLHKEKQNKSDQPIVCAQHACCAHY